jgi:hypothetical protein
MLAEVGDLNGLVALATDPARRQRMLDSTGGDAAALAEITAAVRLVSTSHSPDLLAALRLAWYRDQLAGRNARIPAQLPAVWVTLGQPVRAEALARSITDPYAQSRALARVAEAAAGGGDLHRAEQVALSITDPDEKALAVAVVAAASGGDLDRAEQVARSITDPDAQARALASVASVAEPDRARSCIAGALAVGQWVILLNEVARIDPVALATFADERAWLRGLPDQLDNGPYPVHQRRTTPA